MMTAPQISLSPTELGELAALFDDFLICGADGEPMVPPDREPELLARVAEYLSRCESAGALRWGRIIAGGEFDRVFADICLAAAPMTKYTIARLATCTPGGHA